MTNASDTRLNLSAGLLSVATALVLVLAKLWALSVTGSLSGNTAGANYMSGAGGDDTIIGGWGNDTILGGSGNDSISGSTGNDSLYGNAGNDTLTGGSGSDTFVFAMGGAAEADVVTEFNDRQDTLLLYGIAGATDAERYAALTIADATVNGINGTLIEYAGDTIFLQYVPRVNLNIGDFDFL